jgi:hypothetical protein
MGTRQVILLLAILTTPFSAIAEDSKAARFELANVDQHIMEREEALALNGRTFDPFGKPLDPNKKVEEPKEPEGPSDPGPRPPRILIEKEITRLAKKANILGSTMMIESETYRRGDTIKVKVKGKTFPLKITAISRNKVTFYDKADKNIISLDMNNLPDLEEFGSDEEIDLDGGRKTHDLR